MHPCEERLRRRIEALGSSTIDQYAGNPGSYPFTIGLIDDSDAPNASNFNLSPQGLADRTSYLTKRVGLAGFDWKSRIAIALLPGATTTIRGGAGAWDPLHSQWLLGFGIAGAQSILLATAGMDPGDVTATEWTQIGSGYVYNGAANAPVACAPDPNGAGFWALVNVPSSTEIQVQFVANVSSAWSNSRTVAGAATGAMTTFLGSLFYVTEAGLISSTADQGGTWTDFNTGLGTSNGRFAQSPTVLCMGSGVRIWSTPDGVAWTETTLATGSSHVLVGVDWDTTRSLFVAWLQHVASPYDSQIWTSPDGVTWTESSTGPVGIFAYGFAVVNGDWVATLLDVVSGGPSGQVTSFDGGSTWWLGRVTFPTNVAEADPLWIASQIVSSPFQLMSLNGTWVRFSHLSGLPLLHL